MNFKSSNLHILKKNKTIDIEKSPNLHILKKLKKNKKFRLYVGLTGIDELVFDFFEYMQVWWLFTIKIFDFLEYIQVLCTFGKVLCTAGSQNHAFLASHAGFGEVQVTKPAEGMPF